MRYSRRRFLSTAARAGAAALVPAAFGRAVAWAAANAQPNADLIVRNDFPEHLETTVAALGRSWVTPNELFFVRSHFPEPDVDAAAWRLEVVGRVERPLKLALAELRALPRRETTCVLECAGNGRAGFALPSTSGTQWRHGAVGNARWSGVALADVLKRAGVREDARHVWFECADGAPMDEAPMFVRSLPLEKAMEDVLLADRMNGATLSRAHGFPLRAVVPGWFGMASAKWITRVRLEAEPSTNHFMVRGYRYNAPGEDPARAEPVQELRVKSLITRPLEGEVVAPGRTGLRVEGFAWGAAPIRRVDVSADGGGSWHQATLRPGADPLAWRAWSVVLPTATKRETVILARATDARGAVQPLEARLNAGGYGNNAIHRVRVSVRT